ncbi:MAG: oligosaccharide flippase family protein [bacterium]
MASTPIYKRGVYALLDSIIIAFYSFIYIITVVRSIPQAEYGILVLCDSIRVFLILFTDLSVGQALIKYAAERDDAELPVVITHSLILKLGLLALSALVLLLFAHPIANICQVPELAALLYWVPLVLSAVMLNNFVRQILIAKQNLKQVLWIDVYILCSFLIILSIFKYSGFLISGVQVLWVVALSNILSALPGFWYSRKYLKFSSIIQRDWFQRLSRFAKHSFINGAGVQIYTRIDLFMLAYFLTSISVPINVAIYNTARAFTSFSVVINESMNTIVFPETAKVDLSLGEPSRERIRKIYETASGVLFLIAIPVTLMLFLFPEFILRLFYGGKYQNAASLVRVFAFWGLMHPFYRIAASVFNGIGKPEINAKLTWVGAGVSILVNMILIPWLGALGAAISALVTTMTILVIYVILLHRQFAVRLLAIDFYYLKSFMNKK